MAAVWYIDSLMIAIGKAGETASETISISPWNDGRPRSGEGHVLWRKSEQWVGGMKKKRLKQEKINEHMKRG